MSDVKVTKNDRESRYEAHLDGRLAGYATYRLGEGTVTFSHTLVLPEHEGKGVASAIARASLDDVREAGDRRVIPQCSFYAKYIERHEDDYGDLVAGR